MSYLVADPYKTGVLKREVHERLVANIETIARQAMIQPDWIWKPLAETCSAAEVDYVRRFKFHKHEGHSGLCYIGDTPSIPVETRMAAIAGALLRNFVDARVMTLGQVIDGAEDGDMPDASCILVPNFCVDASPKASNKATQANWKISALLDALIYRHAHGLQTILYARSIAAIGADYGSAVKRHVEAHYVILEA